VKIAGEALKTCLPRLGRLYGARLEAAGDLADQRVTLYGKHVKLETWKEGLRDLLSVPPDAGVYWVKVGKAARLEQSQNRRQVRARNRDLDQEYFRKYLAAELAWARQDGWKELGSQPDDFIRRATRERLVLTSLMDFVGEDRRERLLAGEPLVISIAELRGTRLEELVRDWFASRFRFSRDQVGPPADLDRFSLVFLRERHPFDPESGGLMMSVVTPSGFVPGRSSQLRPAIRQPTPKYLALQFQEGIADVPAAARRVTLCLTPVPDAQPGTSVSRNLNEVLAVLAAETGLTVIADGYLRPPQELPANLTIKDMPLERLLAQIAVAWNCDWRYLGKNRNAVLFRAKHWWLEDEADVPQEQLERLRPFLSAQQAAGLAGFLELAELRTAQVHKLVQAGLCPWEIGVVIPRFYDGTWGKPCLQFFNRLPKAQQALAQRPEGLPLAEVDPALVRTWLYPTLVSMGAITPEARGELVFSLTPLPPEGQQKASPGFFLHIRNARLVGPNWFHQFRLPTSQPRAVVNTPR
jgi:hypothetical protein